MNEERFIFPKQYVGKYKNEEGVLLRPTIFVNLESLELTKIFVESSVYRTLELDKFKGHYIALELGKDSEGRSVVKSIRKVDAE